jgi:outer membrane protein TolC
MAAAPTSAQQADSATAVSLFDALELALVTHPAMRAADAVVERTAADAGVASAEWLPHLGARIGLTQHQEPMLAYPLHELTAADPPVFDRTLIQGGVDLGWTVFDGGGRRARIGAARTQAAGASVQRERSAMDVLVDVSRAYLTVLSTAEILAALDEQLAALDAEADRVRQFLAQGQAAAVERLRVEAATAQARAERITVAARLDASERTLARLLDVEPSTTRRPRLVPLEIVPAPPRDRAALVERLDTNNLEIRRATLAVQAADWAGRAARSAWWPRLEGVGSYGLWTIPTGDAVFEWQVGLRVSYPLFTGGARARRVAAARARADEAVQQLALTRLYSREALDRALTAVEEQGARAAAVATAVDHLSEVTRIEHLALDAGEGTQTDFLRAEADLRRARAELVQAEYGQVLAIIELARATGDLSLDWLRRTLETHP